MNRDGKRLSETEQMVIAILRTNEQARESDDILFYEVCRIKKPSVLDVPLGDILSNYKGHDIPCYESVGRCRRKVQAQFPELRGSKRNQKARYENTVEYEKYARSEIR